MIPASGELEDNREEGSKDCFEIESTKIFTNIVDKLETYYEEKMKIEVVEESKKFLFHVISLISGWEVEVTFWERVAEAACHVPDTCTPGPAL